MMPPRSRVLLLAATTVIVVAFTVTVLLDRPAAHSSSNSTSLTSSGSSSAGTPGTPATSGFQGAALPANVRAHKFTLTDQTGRPVSLSSYRGQVVVIAFVYSTCGSTCIVIAQQIRGALDELSRPVPVLLVSVDPDADTPARVRRFLAQVSLTGRAHYLTGSLKQLRPVWSAYGIDPASIASASASARNAQIESSTGVLLIDGRGFERVLFAVEQLTPEALAHDIRRLQSQP
jgi:protein SCO1/2